MLRLAVRTEAVGTRSSNLHCIILQALGPERDGIRWNACGASVDICKSL